MCNGCWHGVCTNRWILVFVICLSYLFVIVECRAAKNNEIALPRQTVTLSPFLTYLSLWVALPLILGILAATAVLLPIFAASMAGIGFLTLVAGKTLILTSIVAAIFLYRKFVMKVGAIANDAKMSDHPVWPAAPQAQPQPQPMQNFQNVYPPLYAQAQQLPQHKRQDYWRYTKGEPEPGGYKTVFTY